MADTKIAKRHSLLNDVKIQLSSFELTDTVLVNDHTYTLSTLTADEDTWANGFANDKNLLTYRVSTRAPKLAAAIKSIDGVPVEQLITVDDNADKDVKDFLVSQDRKRQFQMNEMLVWLAELPPLVIDALWDKFADLNERRSKSWDALKKS